MIPIFHPFESKKNLYLPFQIDGILWFFCYVHVSVQSDACNNQHAYDLCIQIKPSEEKWKIKKNEKLLLKKKRRLDVSRAFPCELKSGQCFTLLATDESVLFHYFDNSIHRKRIIFSLNKVKNGLFLSSINDYARCSKMQMFLVHLVHCSHFFFWVCVCECVRGNESRILSTDAISCC